ncbi:AIPR family protein [Enterococcus raffinosus]|uniref:AIPR family protein n=1 Tax=Enterococcus raffinosus TaxID=71452 RepID=UPI001C0FD4A8|nr:AIPR family protein [Enterococcus raffinosus]MBU5362748.1 AIPR family protein [Enterococcus raffinosus]
MVFDINKQIVDNQVKKMLEESPELFDGLDKSRALSKAFLILGVASYLDIDVESANSCVTDGGRDGGFDAASIQEASESVIKVVLFQSKYVRDLEKDSNFPSNSIEKSINSIKTIFDPSKSMALNDNSKAVVDEIRSFLDEGYIPDITFVNLNNGLRWKGEGDDFINNAFSNSSQICFEHYNHDDILRSSNKHKKISTQLDLNGVALREDFNYKSVIVGKIDVMQVYRLVEEFGDTLLEKNIRNYLGKNKVNDAIRTTLLDEEKNTNFFFYNNGITITCEKFTGNYLAEKDWKLKIDDLQIINGGQTCKTIHDTIKNNPDRDYSDVSVLVRIYSVDDDKDLIRDITLATNSQNPVDLRDLQANEDMQVSLEKDAELLGYNYKRKRDNSSSAGIPSSVAAEAILTVWRQHPNIAKSKKSEHFSTYYSEIFSNLNASQMVLAVEIYRYCDNYRKKNSMNSEIQAIRRFSNYFIALIMGDQLLSYFGIRLEKITHDNFEELKNWLDDNIDELYEKIEEYVLISVKEQVKIIFREDLDLSRVDGRTLSSIFRNQIIIDQYKNSDFKVILN